MPFRGRMGSTLASTTTSGGSALTAAVTFSETGMAIVTELSLTRWARPTGEAMEMGTEMATGEPCLPLGTSGSWLTQADGGRDFLVGQQAYSIGELGEFSSSVCARGTATFTVTGDWGGAIDATVVGHPFGSPTIRKLGWRAWRAADLLRGK